MVGYWMTPDDENPRGGGYFPGNRPGGQVEHHHDDSPRPSPVPHPTPTLVIDLSARIAALSRTSGYLLNSGVLSTEDLTNQDVKDYFEEKMKFWSDVPEYESLIKPYQLWAGGMLKAGATKFIPIYIAWVPDTNRISIGSKQSVSVSNTGFGSGFCYGVEAGFSPAQKDGPNGSVDQTYNVNWGYIGFTYIPDKSVSIRLEQCFPQNFDPRPSMGITASRGFSQTISKPKQTPWPSPAPGKLNLNQL